MGRRIEATLRFLADDPRHYQIATLMLLLVYGMTRLGFDVTPLVALSIVATALVTQAVCARVAGIAFDARSPLISALSLSLLLRSNALMLLLAAAVIAVTSKFLIRVCGKHVFNPTNGAIVAMMLLTSRVWVSPAQWGNRTMLVFLLACAGGLVVNRAARSDVTYAFAVAYAGILVSRSLWLGEPMTIPIHRLQSGALLIFVFFMISDPRTTPSSRPGRLLFAALVALGAAWIQFKLFRTNGLLWSLAITSCLTPLIDRLLPARLYRWPLPSNTLTGDLPCATDSSQPFSYSS